jgi:glyoxylate/hydroxypyruvate reductase
MPTILFAAISERWKTYEPHLRTALQAAGLGDAALGTDCDPDAVDYIIYAPNSPVQDFGAFPRLKAVLSLWAGVEGIVGNNTLRVPLTRMVDAGLSQGMVEWVTGHVLRHHLGIDAHIHGQDGIWRPDVPPLARHRRVAILGLGALGTACAKALATLNFNVSGWSRSPKSLAGINTYHGADGLDACLSTAEIAVLLLPDTAATENTLNARTLGLMPQGAVILNPGRGPLIDDRALLAALDAGQIGHATLDTFRVEPLPSDHRFWAHPRVTVTPHIASETRAQTASESIARNIARAEAGQPLLHLVDRDLGY